MNRATINKVAVNVAVVFVFSLVSFALAEIVTRAVFRNEIQLFARHHTDARYGEFTLRRIAPDKVFWHTSADGSWRFETNAQGFRNREDFEYEKDEGVIRVLALGDSHTQGYEVRQDFTYSAVIEKFLRAHGFDAQVLNSGVSGFSTAEELVFLENEGIRYEPDFVVLGFFANDFEDNLKAGLFRLHEDGTLSVERTEHVPGVGIQKLIDALPMMQWLGENSYFYSLLFNTVWEYFKSRLSSAAAATAVEYAIPTKSDRSPYEVELAAALLARMHRYCTDRGIPLIIIDVPQIDGGSSVPEALATRVREFSDAYVDSTALLGKYSGVAELHLPRGQNHISEFSHALLGVDAAEKIEAHLKARAQSSGHDPEAHPIAGGGALQR